MTTYKKRWLTPKDFEVEFGINTKEQAKKRSKKVLPYSKIGGFVYYDRNEIEKLLENSRIVKLEEIR